MARGGLGSIVIVAPEFLHKQRMSGFLVAPTHMAILLNGGCELIDPVSSVIVFVEKISVQDTQMASAGPLSSG
jgi:hypothetical protein